MFYELFNLLTSHTSRPTPHSSHPLATEALAKVAHASTFIFPVKKKVDSIIEGASSDNLPGVYKENLISIFYCV